MSERKNNTELSTGIANLSDLMRYVLYDAKVDFIPFEKEIEHLHNMIEVHQLRYDKEDNYSFAYNVEGNLSNINIAPLIFSPFIENAFKYGIELNEASFIKINIQVKDGTILFIASNSSFHKTDNQHNQKGIGLENVKRRLQLLYPEKHLLSIDKTESIFKVTLTINI